MSRAILAFALTALACQNPLPLSICQLAQESARNLERDVDHCLTDNCVAFYVQREAQERAACEGLPSGVAQ